MNTQPRGGPQGDASAAPARPRWAGKPVRRLTADELAEALAYLERHRPDDDVLGRALAGEFARRTAAAEFARRAAGERDTAVRPAPPESPPAPDARGPRG